METFLISPKYSKFYQQKELNIINLPKKLNYVKKIKKIKPQKSISYKNRTKNKSQKIIKRANQNFKFRSIHAHKC